jgi:hypothetical protein
MFPTLRTLRSRVTRATALIGVALAAATLTGCATDRAVGPTVDAAQAAPAPATHDLVVSAGVIPSQALLRTTPLTQAISQTLRITRSGGTFAIPEAGVTVTVPRDAIDTKSLTITVTALAGNAVAYTFEPHGTQFRRPLLLTQDLSATTWATNSAWLLLRGGYFKDAAQVNTTTGKAMLDEWLPLVVSGSRSYLSIWHFSGYMISMD